MGRAIRGTTVKVDGQAGPLGKGVPLTRAAGPGGASQVFSGGKAPQNPQVPGFKGLMERGKSSGGIRAPLQRLSSFAKLYQQRSGGKPLPEKLRGGFFGKVFNQLSQRQSAPMPGGGLFRNRQFAQLAPQGNSAPTPKSLPQTTGVLPSKPVLL